MNQGRIWTVVNPNHGLPLLLGSVTLIALGVHYAVLTHTTWFGDYWQGKAPKPAATASLETPPVAAVVGKQAVTVNIAPSTTSEAGSLATFVVTITPKEDPKVALAAPN